MSNSLQPQGPWPTRFLCSWNFPCKNTGVGCHFLFQSIFLTPGTEPVSPALAGDSSPLRYPRSRNLNSYKCSLIHGCLSKTTLSRLPLTEAERGWRRFTAHAQVCLPNNLCTGPQDFLGLLANDGGSHNSHRDTAVHRWMPNHNYKNGAQKGRLSSASMILTSHLEAQVFYNHLELLATVYSIAKSKYL